MHRLFEGLATILILLSGVGLVAASDLEDRLNLELRGGWGVVEVEVYSACGGTYSDNEVGVSGVASKASYRFGEGELVKIDKINVKRKRVDLLLTLATPFRTSHMDGPFELYEERVCKIQVIVPVSREEIKRGDVPALLGRIGAVMTVFPSLGEAKSSDDWNGRTIVPLPVGYDETLHRHAMWKAEQTNAAVNRGIDDALSAAARIADGLDDDGEYLAGFSEGAESMSSFYTTDCTALLSASSTTYRKSPPSDRTKSWRDGWDDGQELVLNVLLADRLRACRVPVPLPPLE
jgi:hypothetical protein